MAGKNSKKENAESFPKTVSAFTGAVPPVPNSAYTNAAGTIIYIVFDSGNPPVLPTTNIDGFTVKATSVNNNNPIAPVSAIRKGATGTDAVTLVLNLSTPVKVTDTIKVNYTRGSAAFTDSSSNQVINFSNYAVTNCVLAPTSAQTDARGQYIDLVFNVTNGPLLPATLIDGFKVSAPSINSGTAVAPLSAVVISSNTVRLTLVSPLHYADRNNISISYTRGSVSFTDSAVVANQVANFTGFTNVTVNIDHDKPVFSNAYTDIAGRYVYIVFTDATPPLLPSTGNIDGFSVSIDNGATWQTPTITQRLGGNGVSALTLQLQVATRISYGDQVKFKYTPGTRLVTDSAPDFNSVNSIASTSVTNNAVNRHVFFSNATTDYSGLHINVTLGSNISSQILPISGAIPGFTVTHNGTSVAVTDARRISAMVVKLTLASQLTHGETVLVSYTPGSPGITDDDSPPNPLLSFSSQPVTNVTSERIAPVFLYSSPSIDGSFIDVVFQENDNPPLLPVSPRGFSVKQNNINVPITSVNRVDNNLIYNDVAGLTYRLNLKNPLVHSDVLNNIVVSYTQPLNSPIITDSAPIPNKLASFTDGLSYNGNSPYSGYQGLCIADSTAPTLGTSLSDVQASSSGNLITLKINVNSNNILNNVGLVRHNNSGFVVKVNGVNRSYTTVSVLSGGAVSGGKASLTLSGFPSNLTCEDVVTVSYDGSSNITDQSHGGDVGYTTLHPNSLVAFSDVRVDMSLMTDSTPPTCLSASVTSDGLHVDVLFKENRSRPLQPSSNIDGFYVLVNGIPRKVTSSVVKSTNVNSVDSVTVRLTMNSRIYRNDTVQVSYFGQGQSNALKDNASNQVVNFGNITATNNALADAISPSSYFDPLTWIQQADSSPSNGDLYELRVGYPSAQMILSTTAPTGEVVLNENPQTGGIHVHHFEAYSSHDYEVSGSLIDYSLSHTYSGFQFISNGEETLAQISLKMRIASANSASTDVITMSLYSNANGKPGGLILPSPTQIAVASLTTSFNDYVFDLPYALSTVGTKYWLVLTTTTIDGSVKVGEVVSASGQKSTSDTSIEWSAPISGKQAYYKLIAATGSGVPIASYDETQDPMGNPVAKAATYGGANDPNLYEVIGYGEHRSLVKNFSKINGDYPVVKSFEVGLTASRGKAYVVEAIPQGGSVWQPVFYMIADQDSLDYIQYTFSAEVKLQKLRIRYRGDFYALDNNGTVTVSNFTSLTPIKAIQLSHYPDFKDAIELPNSDIEGWLPFDDGTSTFDWQLLNLGLTWTIQPGQFEPFIGGVAFGSGFCLFSKYSACMFSPANGLSPVAVDITSGVSQITCYTVYHDVLYVGCSNGNIYSSLDGVSFTRVFASQSLSSVYSMTVYRGKLWIGTSHDVNKVTKLWSYADNTNSFVLAHTFTEPMLYSMAVYGGYLFVGTAGASGSGQGRVYIFDGTLWSLTFNSDSDSIDALTSSGTTGSIWAGLRGGSFYQLAFDSNVKPVAWTLTYAHDSNICYGITDDPSGNYVWLHTDNGLCGYIKSQKAVNLITGIPVNTNGLNATWTNGIATDYQNLDKGISQVFTTDSTINYANLTSSRPDGVNATYVNVHWDGFIQAPYTDVYTFSLLVNSGVRLYVDNNLIIDSWTDKSSAITVTGNLNMIAGKTVPIRIEYYYGATGTPKIVFQWKSAVSIPSFTVVPQTALFLPVDVTKIIYSGTNPFAINLSGNVYLFDPSFVGNTKRSVYARFKDSVGNITPLPSVPTDEIIQTIGSSGSAKVSDGRIYQVKPDKSIAVTYSSGSSGALRAPDRILLESGVYESEPFYAPTLTRWGEIRTVADLPAGASVLAGLDQGVTIDLYVVAASTRKECLAADYGAPFTTTTIGNPSAAGALMSNAFNISTLNGKWIKFKIALRSASQGYAPTLHSVEITYQASQASYFFTKMFTTSDYSALIPAPVWRRFMITSNEVPNEGSIVWGYTTDTTPGNTFDFGKFIPIQPNSEVPLHHIVELEEAGKSIRFGAQLISVMDAATPPYVNDVGRCRLASTQNVNISTIRLATAIDGVQPAEGDRILLKDQTNKSENGVWIAHGSTAWTRPTTQFNNANQMTFVGTVNGKLTGHFCGITNGATNKNTSWIVKSINTPTSGDINIIEFTAAIIDDFAVQLDAGPVDMKLMPSNPY